MRWRTDPDSPQGGVRGRMVPGKRSTKQKKWGLGPGRSILPWECGSGARRPHARRKSEAPPWKWGVGRWGRPTSLRKLHLACQSEVWPSEYSRRARFGVELSLRLRSAVSRKSPLFVLLEASLSRCQSDLGRSPRGIGPAHRLKHSKTVCCETRRAFERVKPPLESAIMAASGGARRHAPVAAVPRRRSRL